MFNCTNFTKNTFEFFLNNISNFFLIIWNFKLKLKSQYYILNILWNSYVYKITKVDKISLEVPALKAFILYTLQITINTLFSLTNRPKSCYWASILLELKKKRLENINMDNLDGLLTGLLLFKGSNQTCQQFALGFSSSVLRVRLWESSWLSPTVNSASTSRGQSVYSRLRENHFCPVNSSGVCTAPISSLAGKLLHGILELRPWEGLLFDIFIFVYFLVHNSQDFNYIVKQWRIQGG